MGLFWCYKWLMNSSVPNNYCKHFITAIGGRTCFGMTNLFNLVSFYIFVTVHDCDRMWLIIHFCSCLYPKIPSQKITESYFGIKGESKWVHLTGKNINGFTFYLYLDWSILSLSRSDNFIFIYIGHFIFIYIWQLCI